MKITNLYALGSLCVFFLFSKTDIIAQISEQAEIVSQCVTNTELWEKVPQDPKLLSTFNILDHGVGFNFPQNFSVGNVPVSLITKSALPNLGNDPYFLFHTLQIGNEKAFVRLNLVYRNQGDEKIISQELNFTKINNEWQLAKSSF